MTPNNIVGMAKIKGLDIIAVADHNSARNVPAVMSLGKEVDLLVIPAIEVQTREDVHVLSYLPSAEAALELSAWIYERMPDVKNNSSFFGAQLVMDEQDEVIGVEERLLASSVDASIDELGEKVMALGGFTAAAHINRQAHSIIYLLGFIPPTAPFMALEDAKLAPSPPPTVFKGRVRLQSSDAHRLGDISEQENYIELETLDLNGFFKCFT